MLKCFPSNCEHCSSRKSLRPRGHGSVLQERNFILRPTQNLPPFLGLRSEDCDSAQKEASWNQERTLCVFWCLTRACCSPCWCSGFLRHRTWSKCCKVPKAPTRHEPAAGPAPCSRTCRACSTAHEQTQAHPVSCRRPSRGQTESAEFVHTPPWERRAPRNF